MKRFERTERKGVHFTARDQEIVKAVFYARYLANRQIHRLFFSEGAYSSCKNRTRILFCKKYLNKRKTYHTEQDVFFLGLRGRRFIVKTSDGRSQDEVDKIAGVEGDTEAPLLQMKHDLTLSNLYVEAVLQCRQRGWTLQWQNARMLELRRLGVQPDAYLKIPEANKEAFIEFTAVVPTSAEMKAKLEGYRVLLESLNGVPILWFVSSRSKLEQLCKWIKEWVYHDWVLLGLIDDGGEFLTKKMWRWSEKEEPVNFIAPREIILYSGRSACPLTSQPDQG